MGALAATGIPAYHQGFGPGVPGFVHLSAALRLPLRRADSDEAGSSPSSSQELEETIAREGADTIAAMIGEPVQGAGGVVVPPDGYWQAIAPDPQEARHPADRRRGHLRLWPDRHDVRHADRTASSRTSPPSPRASPAATSRSVASASRDEVFDVMAEPDRMFMHGFTYSGHPVACAVGLRNIQIIEDENLPANAGAMGDYLLGELQRLLGDHPNVGNVRGKGLMFFVELAADRDTKEKFDPAQNVGGKLTRRRPASAA